MYFYRICPPNKNGKYHKSTSVVIKEYLKKSPNWRATLYRNKAHYCDCPNKGIIKFELPILDRNIFDKAEQFKIFNNCYFYPKTYQIINNKITNKNENEIPTSSKWFLKPTKSHGGKGIVVILKFQQWKKNVSVKRNYILQEGIDSILYNNKKFDLRSFFLIIVNKKNMYMYLSKDSLMRICTHKYNPNSTRKDINLTNVSVKTGSEKKTYQNIRSFSNWEHFSVVQPKLKKITHDIAKKLYPLIKKKNSVFLSGCDFIIDKKLEPHFLELNTRTGFAYHLYPPNTNKMIKEMLSEMIKIGYQPLIESQVPPPESKQWVQCYSSEE